MTNVNAWANDYAYEIKSEDDCLDTSGVTYEEVDAWTETVLTEIDKPKKDIGSIALQTEITV